MVVNWTHKSWWLPGDCWKRTNQGRVPFRAAGHPLGEQILLLRRDGKWIVQQHGPGWCAESVLQCAEHGKIPSLRDVVLEIEKGVEPVTDEEIEDESKALSAPEPEADLAAFETPEVKPAPQQARSPRRRGVDELTPAERRAIVEQHHAGSRTPDIAEALGIAPVTVRRVLTAAGVQLKRGRPKV